MELISYGKISKEFKVIAQLCLFLQKIKNKEIIQNKIDCYPVTSLPNFVNIHIIKKFKETNLNFPRNVEVFYPSQYYPPHTDDGGTSYFIGLEKGNFLIENTSYPIVPFVLYAFEDSKEHNTDFAAIMLK